ncbi:hypothetical protein OAC97_03765 [Flavobacteriaceae bacterium]|nr:hypothetical protein [Flavobacteriaceae bacterium]
MKASTQFCISLFLLLNFLGFSQTSLNNYKYVSVPEKFDFLKSNDQYQLNSLTVFLLKKEGFTTLNKSDNYPMDLAQNNCLMLNANVVKLKGLLTTKLQLVLTDCKNTVVFSSEIGKSKLKEYQKAYHEALRDAFELSEFNYAYNGSNASTAIPIPKTPTPEPMIVEPAPVIVTEVVVEKMEPQEVMEVVPTVEVATGIIIQQTNSGYDFIDGVSKTTKYSAHATLFDNVYIIDGQEGIIYKRGQNWVREYVENGKTTIEALNIQR